MLFPEKWGEVKGFFDALTLPNVFPRYFHFIIASMAITGLFLAWWLGRSTFNLEADFETISGKWIRKQMLTLAFVATGMQFIFGPLLFLTLPSGGVTWSLFWVIMGGVTIAIIVLFQLWKLINETDKLPGKRFYILIGLVTALIGFMGTGRHIYRSNALETHRLMMAERTLAHWEAVRQAHENLLLPHVESEKGSYMPGQDLFQTNCAVCHAAGIRLVGPAMAEIVPDYQNREDALKQWIKNPGRKRLDYPPMAGFPHLSDKQLTDISDYVLQKEWK
jgi:cytochrome c